jgi:hypothetical protein
MALTSTAAGVGRALIAAQVCGGLALAFGHIYLGARADRWWAILPGGFMLVLALVVGASGWVASTEVLAALLFLGLGLVFFLLYVLDGKRRQWWALIPGSVLLVFGMLALSTPAMEEAGIVRWWPLTLVAIGLLVALIPRRRPPPAGDKFVVSSAPAARSHASSAATGKSGKDAGKGGKGSALPPRAALGEYSQPAPGASVEILNDND